MPVLWLLVFFLVPFLVVAKLSLSEAAIAQPPYLPLVEWTGDQQAIITLNFGNFSYLFDDPLYLRAYLSSLKIAFVSAVLAHASSAIRSPLHRPQPRPRGARSY